MEWEYCILIATTNGKLLSENFRKKTDDLLSEMRTMGCEGWELVDTVLFVDDNKAQRIQYNFKRRIY